MVAIFGTLFNDVLFGSAVADIIWGAAATTRSSALRATIC